jgi:hypothetical protein
MPIRNLAVAARFYIFSIFFEFFSFFLVFFHLYGRRHARHLPHIMSHSTMHQTHPFRCPNRWVTSGAVFIDSVFIRLLTSSSSFFTLVVVSMSCMPNMFFHLTSLCIPPRLAEQLLSLDVMMNRSFRGKNMFKRSISATRRLHGLPLKQCILQVWTSMSHPCCMHRSHSFLDLVRPFHQQLLAFQ